VRHPARLPLEQLEPFLLPLPEPPTFIDWATLFGNPHPVELEVGFGKGLFLLNSALARPDVNFAGVEIVRKYQLFTATRIAKRGLSNVRLACADARLFLRDRVAADSLQAVHVYFPDPWWKKRHHKRRVFTPEFAAECQRVLRPGGRLHLATDVPDYFELSRETVREQTSLVPLPDEAFTGRDGAVGAGDFLTNFERKAILKGTPVSRGVWVKPLAAGPGQNPGGPPA